MCANSNSSGCTGWAKRSTAACLRAAAARMSPAASTRRSAAIVSSCRTWFAGCSKTAPTRRSSTGLAIRASTSATWWPIRSTAQGRGTSRRRRGSRCPPTSSHPSGAIPKAFRWPISTQWPSSTARLRKARTRSRWQRRWWAARRRPAPHAMWSSPPMAGARPERSSMRTGAPPIAHWTRLLRASARGTRAPRKSAPRSWTAQQGSSRTIARHGLRCWRAKPARRVRQRFPKCAKLPISAATTRRRPACASTRRLRFRRRPAKQIRSHCADAACSRAFHRGTFRWPSSPARSRRHSPQATRSSPSLPSRPR